jgi:hypothetical protein
MVTNKILQSVTNQTFVQLGEINCLFLPLGGVTIPRYILQFLFSKNAQK